MGAKTKRKTPADCVCVVWHQEDSEATIVFGREKAEGLAKEYSAAGDGKVFVATLTDIVSIELVYTKDSLTAEDIIYEG